MCVNRLVLFPPVNLSVAKFSGPTTESALVKGKCFPQQYKLRGGGILRLATHPTLYPEDSGLLSQICPRVG